MGNLPDSSENILENGLGVIPPGGGKVQVKLGPTQKGTLNTLYAASNSKTAKTLIGSGPLLEAAALVLDEPGGGSVIFVPSLPTNYGTVTGGFSLSGSGTGTVTGSKGPESIVRVKITLGGSPGTMKYRVALGATGAYGAEITSTADPYSAYVAGQSFTKLVFGNFTYIADDVYQLNLDGTVTRTGSGTSTALDSSVHSPVDAYELRVKIATAGALGAGAFQYSLDGETNYTPPIILPAGGKYVIPGTGVVLTFAGTFVLGDVYSGAATPPTSSSSDVNTALIALRASPQTWDHVHVVGTPSNAAGALTMAGVLSTQMTAAEAQHKFVYAIGECPAGEGDATLISTFASFVDRRVGIGAGDCYVKSPLTGLVQKRNAAWPASARATATKISTHPGQVDTEDNGGALKSVKSLVRDEGATEALDAARFITLRTIESLVGYFVTRGRLMATPGSDFEEWMNLRVMNRTATVGRAAALLYLNKKLRITPKGFPRAGFIDERDAQGIEKMIRAKCKAAVVSTGDASDVVVVVNRTDNILQTKTLNIEVGPVPLGYAEHLPVTYGFKNLALQAA